MQWQWVERWKPADKRGEKGGLGERKSPDKKPENTRGGVHES